MMKRGSQTAALLLWAMLAAFGLAGAAHAQTTASVAGRVTNQEGAPVAGARVQAANVATGASSAVVTRADGRFLIAALQPGNYRVTVSGLGFATATSDARLVLGQTAEVNFSLSAQAVALEGITVSGERSAVFSPSRTGASSVVGQEAIENLPTLTRNFTDVAALSPFVYVTGSAPSVAGSNNRMNNIQIDGAVNNDVFGLADSGVPGGQANAKPISLDAISQFQVLVAPFDVRQSGFAGGLINAVTKSGTNRFTGTAFGGYRNLGFIREDLTINPPGVVPLRQTLTAGDFENAQFGFSLGGPIIRDRLHFFTANEFERRTIPEVFGIRGEAATIGVQPDSVQRFIDILEDRYGVNPGIADTYSRENPTSNLFGRLDWTVNDRHRLTLRHNYVRARDDDQASRGGTTFELESATYDFKSITNSTVAQLNSQLSDRFFNELLFNFQTIRDRRAPAPEYLYPSVDVRTTSNIGGTNLNSTLRAGSELFSQANELDQDIFQITNNFTANFGGHRFTVGAQGEHYKFRNLFVPTSLGQYVFNSLADFEANRPATFAIAVPAPGVEDAAARFSVMQLSGYVQDEFTATDELTFTAGLRLDVPRLLDEPINNPDFQTQLGFPNSRVPETSFLWSPRVGFNWQPAAGPQTQVRGGIGLFTGRPPFVWLSNAYGNTGLNAVTLNCTGTNAPGFATTAPTACVNGTTATTGGTAIINVLDDDFRFPQELKVSLGVDRELPFGFTATIEGLYTKAVNQIFTGELNLRAPQPAVNEPGIGQRLVYGTRIAGNFQAYTPNRISNSRFAHVTNARNTNDPYSYMLSLELQRRFFDLWNVRGSYAFMRAYDTQSQTSSQATSNTGFNPIQSDINNPPLTRSNFDRPHKVVLSLQSEPLFERFGGTEFSVFYLGQSGKPYAYVYDGDINGDGYETSGTVNNRNNDLLYVPQFSNEVTFQNADQQRLFEELVALEPCLQEQRGEIMERNSCRAPWTNQVDLKLRQGLPFRAANNLKIELDVFNLGNLLNSEWGLQRGPAFSQVDLLLLRGRRGGVNGPMEFSYDGFTARDDNNVLRATKPYDTFFASRYTIRLGARLDF